MTSTGRLNVERRNSYRFAPLKIASANCGLIDNKARVSTRESEDRRELISRDRLESPWRGMDILDQSRSAHQAARLEAIQRLEVLLEILYVVGVVLNVAALE